MKLQYRMRKGVVLRAGFLAATLLFFPGETTHQLDISDRLTANEIIGRMGTVYSTCSSYRDLIQNTTLFQSDTFGTAPPTPLQNSSERKVFSTVFARPKHFRFEELRSETASSPNSLAAPEVRYIVWCQGAEVKSTFEKPGQQNSKTLALALSMGPGRVSLFIPSLLFAEHVGGPLPLTSLIDAARIPDEKLKGVDCFRVQGQFKEKPTTLWIDRNTFLLRRIDQETRYLDLVIIEKTTYDPLLNPALTDRDLSFNGL